MHPGCTVAVASLVALAACGGTSDPCGSTGGGLKRRWLDRPWVATTGDLEGVAFTVDVPKCLPANTEALIGKDWWAGVDVPVEELARAAGPRLSLDRPRERSFADPEALARHVEPDAGRLDLIEVAKERLADGRLRYASAVKDGTHLDVTVWIPLDATRGVRCTAHWWAGVREPGPRDRPRDPRPDPEIIAWLDRFCASVRLFPAKHPAPEQAP